MEKINQKVEPRQKGSKVLFGHPILEKLTRTHISIPVGIFTIISSIMLYVAFSSTLLSTAIIFLVFFGGWLIFSWIEYMVHKHIFHMFADTQFKTKIQYTFHGVHHEFPLDKERLAMPPLVSLTITALLFFIFRFIMGEYVYAFLPGFLLGYAAYLMVHYAVHAWQPPNNVLKILWKNHSIHHYKDDERAYGVSSPLWDYIYGTMPKKR